MLLVGAGGIGCELLKNLVLTGFGSITLIDLDTIDLSNLNRQFLFRHEHIKQSKALIAKKVASPFNLAVNIEAHLGNIKDSQYDVDWYKRFTLVFNALDNLDARRWVNRMCLAANIPLIESGTTGYNGQVQVIQSGQSECYDCTEKAVPKSFPICTIRSTPSQPIHCIVWAKSYLFQEIFGTSEDEVADVDQSKDSKNAEEIDTLTKEARGLQDIRASMSSPDFARKIVQKVFIDDIQRLCSMTDMWRGKKPPKPLDLQDLDREVQRGNYQVASQDQKVWNLNENYAVFRDSLDRLSRRYQSIQASRSGMNGSAPPVVLSFDKDDEDTLDFVAAASNLRSHVFWIEEKSKFDIKQMAGNIIPAIATTNAIVAGLCVTEALKLLRSGSARRDPSSNRTTPMLLSRPSTNESLQSYSANGDSMELRPPQSEATISRRSRNIFLTPTMPNATLSSERLCPPNPSCAVCSVAYASVLVDFDTCRLNDLIDDVIIPRLGYHGDFAILNEKGPIYDPDFDDNLDSLISSLGVRNGSGLRIVDENDEVAGGEPDVRVDLELGVKAMQRSMNGQRAILDHEVDIAKKKYRRAAPGVEPKVEPQEETYGVKRKRSAGEDRNGMDTAGKRQLIGAERTSATGGSQGLAVDVDIGEETAGSGVIDLG